LSDHIGALQKKTIIVNGYATADITQEQLRQWADTLTYVSCYSYGFNLEGDLIPVSDENLIRYAYEDGVAPLLVITPVNESGTYSYELLKEVFTNPRMRDRFINNIVLTVLEKQYYGAVFNFGYIAAEDRDQFVITVSKTAARLNRMGALVMVSLIMGMNNAGIDYVSLSRAANFIELRAADVLPIDQGKILLELPNNSSDVSGLRARLELVASYELAGVSIWTIMEPFPAGIAAINEMFTVFKV
jgi:spore germination protein